MKLDLTPRNWSWILRTGVLTSSLGIIAFTIRHDNIISLVFGLASILVAVGLLHLVQAVLLYRQHGGDARILQAAIPLVIGLSLWSFPSDEFTAIVIALSGYFLLSAVVRAWSAIEISAFHGWGWAINSAAIALVLGIWALRMNAVTALSVPGTLLGMDLLFEGISLIGFAVMARQPNRLMSHQKVAHH